METNNLFVHLVALDNEWDAIGSCCVGLLSKSGEPLVKRVDWTWCRLATANVGELHPWKYTQLFQHLPLQYNRQYSATPR